SISARWSRDRARGARPPRVLRRKSCPAGRLARCPGRRIGIAPRPERGGQIDDDLGDRRLPAPTRRDGARARPRHHRALTARDRGGGHRPRAAGAPRVRRPLGPREPHTRRAARVRRLGTCARPRALPIARALMRNPTVLLLDEPSEGLAPRLVDEVGQALERLRESGLAILLVEQNLALATRLAQRLFVMNKGTIVFSGTPDELGSSGEVEARYLGV